MTESSTSRTSPASAATSATHRHRPPPAASPHSSDVNGDGTVNILDLVLAGGNFGKTDSALVTTAR